VTDLTERLSRLIDASGPISVAQYMGLANAHYYGTRDPLGLAGDFTTAPEISQMFGELVGLWLADLWVRAGTPDSPAYLELGPGRGTLAADALRAMRSARLTPAVHLVETSPALRKLQFGLVPSAQWHDELGTVLENRPILAVANEFFDALPVHQLVRTERGWAERVVTLHDGCFMPVPGPSRGRDLVPTHLRDAPLGTILETSPASLAVMRQLASLIARSGGVALIMDYGHDRTSAGETLQAVAKHGYADPWNLPGERDLTAHVDFQALGEAARAEGVRVHGPVGQGDFLAALGIEERAAALAKASPDRADEIEAARHRLTAPAQMGDLFRVLALVAPSWPEPAGFA
jgi:SAM-dependent MidA family methyltransferase